MNGFIGHGVEFIQHWLIQGGVFDPKVWHETYQLDRKMLEDDANALWAVSQLVQSSAILRGLALNQVNRYKLATKEGQFGEFVKREIAACVDAQIKLIGYSGPHYPPMLRWITDPPLALYSSRLPKDCSDYVAIVGARKATGHAMTLSFDLGYMLARLGKAVVSGGAMGCDIAAHLGSVKGANMGASLSIQAGGLACLYPRCNHLYFQKMHVGGAAFLSERPINWRPLARCFPMRNRLIAGLSRSVVLIQAAVRSGASITVSEAMECGRDVYVYGGKQGDIRYTRNHQLIEEGATAFLSVEELAAFLDDATMRITEKDLRRGS